MMKVTMIEIKKESELSFEKLLDIPYKELLKMYKDPDTNEVTKERVRKVIKVMRNSFFAGMKKAHLECVKPEIQIDVDSMYPEIPFKKEVTE